MIPLHALSDWNMQVSTFWKLLSINSSRHSTISIVLTEESPEITTSCSTSSNWITFKGANVDDSLPDDTKLKYLDMKASHDKESSRMSPSTCSLVTETCLDLLSWLILRFFVECEFSKLSPFPWYPKVDESISAILRFLSAFVFLILDCFPLHPSNFDIFN